MKKVIFRGEIIGSNDWVNPQLSRNGGEYYRHIEIFEENKKYYLEHHSSYEGAFCPACGSYNDHMVYTDEKSYYELLERAPERNRPQFCQYEEIKDLEVFLVEGNYVRY